MNGDDPKSDPRVATHTSNIISANHTTNGILTQIIINQPNHLSRCRNDCPACHRRCGESAREFEPKQDGSPAGKRHRRGAQLRVYLLDSWEGKRDRKVRLKLSRTPTTPVLTSGVIVPTSTWMVGLTNNLCAEIPLLVWVAKIMLVV